MPDKDPNVFSFMMQLVQQKYGSEVEADFLTQEAERLYDTFGDVLVRYFEPLLTDEQKRQFDSLVKKNADQNEILEFLMSSVDNLDMKIKQVLVKFTNEYLQSENTNSDLQ